MEKRRLGRTGHESSVAILGGAAFALSTTDEAEPAFAAALARGVNHLDIAPRYGDAERAVGPLAPARPRPTLHRREDEPAPRPTECGPSSTSRCSGSGTDHFDLYQMHAVTGIDVLDERRDAAETAIRARDEGLTRFIGITGAWARRARHVRRGPPSLRPRHRDVPRLPAAVGRCRLPPQRRGAPVDLRRSRSRRHGHQGRSPANRGDDDRDRFATTWYEPRREPDSIATRRALRAVDAGRARVLHAGRSRPAAARARRGREIPSAGLDARDRAVAGRAADRRSSRSRPDPPPRALSAGRQRARVRALGAKEEGGEEARREDVAGRDGREHRRLAEAEPLVQTERHGEHHGTRIAITRRAAVVARPSPWKANAITMREADERIRRPDDAEVRRRRPRGCRDRR